MVTSVFASIVVNVDMDFVFDFIGVSKTPTKRRGTYILKSFHLQHGSVSTGQIQETYGRKFVEHTMKYLRLMLLFTFEQNNYREAKMQPSDQIKHTRGYNDPVEVQMSIHSAILKINVHRRSIQCD